MHMRPGALSIISLGFFASLYFSVACGFTVPFVVRQASGLPGDPLCSTCGLVNAKDIAYIANITVGGKHYVVQLETALSELSINADLSPPNVNVNTSLQINNVDYSYTGSGARADISFAGYSLPDEQFVLAKFSGKDRFNLSRTGADGFMGLGFTPRSQLWMNQLAFTDKPPLGFLDRLFKENPSMPPVVSVVFDREESTSANLGKVSDFVGNFTVGIINRNINITARIPLFPPREISTLTDSDPGFPLIAQWTILINDFSINGQKLKLDSGIADVPPGKAVASFDSGSPFITVPSEWAEALYTPIGGVQMQGVWSLPCDKQPARVVISIGNQNIEISSLDVNRIEGIYRLRNGTYVTNCVGGLLGGNSLAQMSDIALGIPYFRSSQIMFSYGRLNDQGDFTVAPYVQVGGTIVHFDIDFNISRLSVLFEARGATLDERRAILSGEDGVRVALGDVPERPAPAASSNKGTPENVGSSRLRVLTGAVFFAHVMFCL